MSAYGIIWAFADHMNSRSDLRKMNSFGQKYYDMPGMAAASFYEAVAKIESNMQWMETNLEDIKQFLQDVSARRGY